VKLRSGRHRYVKLHDEPSEQTFLILQIEEYEWTGLNWFYSWRFAAPSDMAFSTIIEA
jgi:hypothetical protein